MYNWSEKLREKKGKHRRSKHPCFLCDEPTYDWDHMCRDCRKDWYAGCQSREGAARMVGRDKPERVPIRHHWSFTGGWLKDRREIPDLYKTNARIREAAIGLAQGKEDEFVSFFSSFSGFIRASYIGTPGQFEEGNGIYTFPRRGVWKLLKDLTFAIRDLANYYYNKGWHDGSNLLVRIMDGDLSIDQINKRMVRK